MPKEISSAQVAEKGNNVDGKVYIQVSLIGFGDGFIDDPEHAKQIIDEMVENATEYGVLDAYEFRPVIMTETEFSELPEFTGF